MASDAPALTRPLEESEPAEDSEGPGPFEKLSRRQAGVLVLAVFSAGLCSIVYELLIGTASSYFLGDSIRQFSITIGLFMAAMGIGSLIARKLGDRVLGTFVGIEVGLGILGGLCIPILYAAYAYTDLYTPAMVAFIVAIGTLTGLEIPILVLAMRRFFALNVNLSNILSLDYFGALGATLLFPFVLLPLFGTFKSSLAVGTLNLIVALIVLRVFREHFEVRQRLGWAVAAIVSLVGLGLLLVFSSALLRPWHEDVYDDRVVYARQSDYQKIVLTQHRTDLRLYLNGNLQFASWDEYRYHEALVHPALSVAPRRGDILILGGGDGLAARELLKYDDVNSITLVDLDPAITKLATSHHQLRELNQRSLESGKVQIHNRDAWVFLNESERRWDVVLADLPDPNDTSLARLYSREFFGLVKQHLAKDGVLVTQATSPFFAKEAYWCIVRTLEQAGFRTRPFHANVPSFGDWGFVMAAGYEIDLSRLKLEVPTRFLDESMLSSLFEFPRDLRTEDAPYSTLDEPRVLRLYIDGWRRWR